MTPSAEASTQMKEIDMTRPIGQRIAFLAVGATLLIGGIAGISRPDGLLATKIGAGIAIGVALYFLRMAAVGRRKKQT